MIAPISRRPARPGCFRGPTRGGKFLSERKYDRERSYKTIHSSDTDHCSLFSKQERCPQQRTSGVDVLPIDRETSSSPGPPVRPHQRPIGPERPSRNLDECSYSDELESTCQKDAPASGWSSLSFVLVVTRALLSFISHASPLLPRIYVSLRNAMTG